MFWVWAENKRALGQIGKRVKEEIEKVIAHEKIKKEKSLIEKLQEVIHESHH